MGSVVEDKASIHELALRYCRGVDRADAGLIESCFVAGGTVDTDGTDRPAEELAQRIADDADGSLLTHFVGNHLIEVDGDRAVSELYIIAYRIPVADGAPAGPLRIRSGRYLSRAEKVAGVWAFSSLTLVEDWVAGVPFEAMSGPVAPVLGRRGPTDPSYANTLAAVSES
jgi:hypothetical protein